MAVFGGADIKTLNEKVRKETEERTAGDKRELIPVGHQRLLLTGVKYNTYDAKKVSGSKLHAIELEFSHPETDKYKPIRKNYTVEATPNQKGELGQSQDSVDISVKMLVGFFQNAFSYNTPDVPTYEQLVSAYQKFVGKAFQAAVRWQPRLFIKSNDEIYQFNEAQVWYVGHADDAKFTVTHGTHILPMKEQDAAIWSDFKRKQDANKAADAAGSASPGPARGTAEGLDDLPF